MTSIEGAVALVTGGQRGLGKALARELLNRGAAKVYVTARVPVPEADERLVPVRLEVADADSVAALAARATDVSIVVNNAGAAGSGTVLAADIEEAKALFDINVFGPLRVAQAFAPVLAANGGGALVDVHSVLSWATVDTFGLYPASKAAFWSVTNALRAELAPAGTQVVGVHLGFTDTEMIRALDVEKADPADVAAVTFDAVEKGESEVLADDLSRQVKGLLSGPVEALSRR